MQNPLHTTATIGLLVGDEVPIPIAHAPEFSAETVSEGWLLNVRTQAGRIYRLSFGKTAVAQQPREDFAPYAGFRCEATSEGDITTITAHIPPAAIKEGYRLLVRGPHGHFRAELTDKDVAARPAPGVVRFRWQRTGKALGDSSARLILQTPMHLAEADFATPVIKPTSRAIEGPASRGAAGAVPKAASASAPSPGSLK